MSTKKKTGLLYQMSHYKSGKYGYVSRNRPCPVCGKADWCAVADDGSAAICQRVESRKRMPKGGYLHRFESNESLPNISMTVPKPKTAKPKMSPEELASRQIGFLNSITDIDYQVLAKAQGVSVGTLRYFGVGCHFSFDHASECYTIPQRSLDGELCGFRTMSKTPERDKRSITGSRSGAFFDRNQISRQAIEESNYLLICEGFSDAMLAYDLGFKTVIGRSNCVGELDQITNLVGNIQPKYLLIVPDADSPGRDGTQELIRAIEQTEANTEISNIGLPDGHDIRSWCVTEAKKKEFTRFLQGRINDGQ
tara:strand:+ start:2513 stop:3439 length:927 start_codon:yes stop_codon:yes gene_type:complete